MRKRLYIFLSMAFLSSFYSCSMMERDPYDFSDAIGSLQPCLDVDLGLSVKWAACNVGATTPEEFGDYFSWGETEFKNLFTMDCKHYSNMSTIIKYNASDGKNRLDHLDDVAQVNWGGNWRMPTWEEFQELKDNCTWTWTTQNGRSGYKVTSNKTGYTNCSIFLPAAGSYSGNSNNSRNEKGFYWSNSLSDNDPDFARSLSFDDHSVKINGLMRFEGLSVRPVCTSDEYYERISISFDIDTLFMTIHGSTVIEPIVKDGSGSVTKVEIPITWSSSNTSVAIVDKNGEVKALSSGIAVIIASYESESASFVVVIQKAYENGYEYVDLGLKVKWAVQNVGAEKPEDHGDYYAWGETQTKSYYSWSTYKYCEGASTSLTKYNSSSSAGIIDDKVTIESEDDVAHVRWGGNWRIPKSTEIKELISNCTWKWTTQNGVSGYKVTSRKSGYTGCSIFLPITGYRTDTDLKNNDYGCYWSSLNYYYYDPRYSICLYFNLESASTTSISRNCGLIVRPVCP